MAGSLKALPFFVFGLPSITLFEFLNTKDKAGQVIIFKYCKKFRERVRCRLNESDYC